MFLDETVQDGARELELARSNQELRRSEEALRLLNEQLEDRVRQRTAELESAKARAESSDVAKSQFLATVSHEIRTPLNGVLGLTDLLSETPLSEVQSRYLQATRESAQSLLRIVNDVLDFSRIQAGKLEVEKIDVDLFELIARTVAHWQLRALEKQVDIEHAISAHAAKRLRTDPARLRQILDNLLGNALKFTDHGHVRLTVSIADSPKEVRFAVSDTGIGLTEDQAGRLFVPFTQADASTTRKYGGTGLGLAICRHLVELLGGRIGVKSEPGKGSCFWFTLPVGADLPAIPATTAVTKHEVLASLAGRRVLLVEDNPVNQMVATGTLRALGVTVRVVASGEEAVEAVLQESVDAVLMDCQMPVMDGFEATKRIRESEQLEGKSRLPIIALTANAMQGDRERCLAAGMDDFIAKPFSKAQLHRVLSRWLEQASERAIVAASLHS